MRTPNEMVGRWCKRQYVQAMLAYWRLYWRCAICNGTFNVSIMCHNCCKNWSTHQISMWKWNGNSRHGVNNNIFTMWMDIVKLRVNWINSICKFCYFFLSVPLMSRLCPSDTYKVYKRGSNVRIDTTLLGFDQTTWQRGDRSYIFKGQGMCLHISYINVCLIILEYLQPIVPQWSKWITKLRKCR